MGRPQLAASDRGESLIEILMALVIMGICFAAVLAGIGTSVRTSDINRQQALDTSYVRALAESIEAQAFVPCAGTGAYSTSSALPTPSTFTATIESVEHVEAVSLAPVTPCVAGSDRLQRITVKVQPPDARAESKPLVVLKRRS